MLLTLSALSFLFGFILAVVVSSRPKEARDAYFSLNDSLRNLRHILHAFKPSAPSAIYSSSASEGNHVIPTDDANLLTKHQCEQLPEETWQRQAYEALKSILLARNEGAKRFPCIYATSGYKHDEHRYIFMHSDDPSEPRNLRLIASAMRAYLPQSHSMGPNTSLVIIHPPPPPPPPPPSSGTNHSSPSSVETYHHKFWTLLRGLRTCDLRPWPSDIPSATSAAKWAFCFDGVPWFPAAMTPAHSHRQSRYAPNFTVAMQPKWVFDNLFKTPERRRAAVDAVRKLMPAFDEIEPSPDLSAYGTEGTTEAHQYYLLDENRTSYCPYEDLDR